MGSIGTTIYNAWRRAKRQWRVRLGRKRAEIGLFLLLTLMPAESLLCIIHCQVWLPMMMGSYMAAQHHHHHSMAAAPFADAEQVGASATAPDGSAGVICFLHIGPINGSNIPFHIPPSPVHEMMLAAVALLVVLLLIVDRPPALRPHPPRAASPPLLRPPIRIAA